MSLCTKDSDDGGASELCARDGIAVLHEARQRFRVETNEVYINTG